MLDVGSCNLHVVHISCLEGVEVFGDETSEFLEHLYDYFEGFPSRGNEYQESQVLEKKKKGALAFLHQAYQQQMAHTELCKWA